MTLKEIINKIKKLKQKYKSEKDKAKKSENGRKKPWKYFQQLHGQIFIPKTQCC